MIYLVVIERTYEAAGYGPHDQSSTVKYETVKYFDNVESLERYLLENNEKRYAADVVKRVLKAEELKPVFKVSLSL